MSDEQEHVDPNAQPPAEKAEPEPEPAPAAEVDADDAGNSDAQPAPAEEEAPEDPLALLRAELATRRAALAEREAEIKMEVEGTGEFPATPEALKAAQHRHQDLRREMEELDRRKVQTTPEYEFTKLHPTRRADAAQLTADVHDHEVRLGAAKKQATALEAEVAAVSARYKDEQDKRAAFTADLVGMVTGLQRAVTTKISLTCQQGPSTSPPADDNGASAYAALQDVSDAVMARGRQMATLRKELRDQEAMVGLNEARLATVNDDCDKRVAELRQRKDEGIREAVFGFQDDRAKLQCGIEDLQAVQKSQAARLKAGDTQKKQEVGTFGKQKGRAVSKLEEEEQMLVEQATKLTADNAGLQDDVHSRHEDIKSATKSKSELLKDEKVLTLRVSRDREQQEQQLNKTAVAIQNAQATEERQGRENDKLAEAVQTLTKQLKRLRDSSGHERTTQPLPVD